METIDNMILNTFKILATAKEDGKIEAAMIRYPDVRQKENKNDKDIFRVSEQEAKQIFLNELWKNDTKFSVETPTKGTYKFGEDPIICGNSDGIAAQIDVTVYDNNGENHHIEFKAHNVEKEHIIKDILKLKNEGNDALVNYFVHILGSATQKTIETVIQKYKEGLKKYEKSKEKLEGKRKVVFYVFNHGFNQPNKSYYEIGYWVISSEEIEEFIGDETNIDEKIKNFIEKKEFHVLPENK